MIKEISSRVKAVWMEYKNVILTVLKHPWNFSMHYTVILLFYMNVYARNWNPIVRDKDIFVVQTKINASVSTKTQFDHSCYTKHNKVQSSNIHN